MYFHPISPTFHQLIENVLFHRTILCHSMVFFWKTGKARGSLSIKCLKKKNFHRLSFEGSALACIEDWQSQRQSFHSAPLIYPSPQTSHRVTVVPCQDCRKIKQCFFLFLCLELYLSICFTQIGNECPPSCCTYKSILQSVYMCARVTSIAIFTKNFVPIVSTIAIDSSDIQLLSGNLY